MIRILLTSVIILFSLTAFSQIEVGGSKDGKPAPKVWMESNIYNCGKIPWNTPMTYTFEIKNTGNAPLLITKAEPTCNCTLVDYTKTEIAPGELGFVKATYDAKYVGQFQKAVFLFTNAYEGQIDLTLKGEVIQVK